MCVMCMFFFFKQKTAYEMRISDWSSDVCSSDLGGDSGAGISSPAPTHSEKDSSLLRGGGGLQGLDPAGAELELRDLAEGIELRVGQHVGRRLVEAEGDEHHALRHVAVGDRKSTRLNYSH